MCIWRVYYQCDKDDDFMYMNIRRDQKGIQMANKYNTTTPETAHLSFFSKKNELLQVGFEPTTSCLQGKCSTVPDLLCSIHVVLTMYMSSVYVCAVSVSCTSGEYITSVTRTSAGVGTSGRTWYLTATGTLQTVFTSLHKVWDRRWFEGIQWEPL